MTKSPFRPVPSLALASLCAFIERYKKFDYNLKAVDLNIEGYAEPGMPVDTTVYEGLLKGCIESNEYDVLCLSTMFVFNVKWVDAAVRFSKKLHPEAKIIIGGGYPTLFPERCLEEHGIDTVVIGEGEAVFLHILNRYNNYHDPEFEKRFTFEGYGTMDENGKIVISKQRRCFIDLGDLPIPAWNYLNVEKYFRTSGDKVLPIEGSRGCPYCCSYCCTYISWGRQVRYKPVERLIAEISEMKKRYRVDALHFVDDNLSFDKDWIKEFLRRIISMKLPLKFTASNFSSKNLDGEIIDLLVKTGMDRFSIAVESGCPEMQKRINKNLNLEKIREMVKQLKARKLYIHLCWMIGFPNETMEQINRTFNFARELRAHSNQFLTVLPYPGTQLFDEAKSAGLLVFQDDELDKFDNRRCDYLKSDEWNYDKLQKMIYDINIELNFLNNISLDTEEGMDYMLGFLENLMLRLPEHIVARIIIGYIYKKKNNMAKHEEYYNSARSLFKEKKLSETFSRYLSWKHPIVEDFNRYLETKGEQR